MKNLSITLRQISNNYTTGSGTKNITENNTGAMATFGQYNNSKFSQVINIFGNSELSTITPGECDWAFNILLRDTNLLQTNPSIWNIFAEYLADTIKYITAQLDVKTSNYKQEYPRFMNERETFRNSATTTYISLYNNNILDWRLSRK